MAGWLAGWLLVRCRLVTPAGTAALPSAAPAMPREPSWQHQHSVCAVAHPRNSTALHVTRSRQLSRQLAAHLRGAMFQ